MIIKSIILYDPIDKLIKNSVEIIPNNQKKLLLTNNLFYTAPKLHPFTKLHKNNHLIRLLINFKIAPPYSLVKYLDTLINAN